MQRILIVEPDTAYRGRTSGALAPLSCDIVLLDDAESAIQAMMAEMPALVIAGCDEPQESELRMVRLARQGSRPVPVLVLARTGSTRGAIDFMDAGAYDYLAKPGDPAELLAMVRDILRLSNQSGTPVESSTEDAPMELPGSIIGRSPEMIEIYKMVGRIAKSDAAVLIQGESGTGKELVAQTIHENSRRAGKPFLAVNCAAIPETLLESELFGHEKGAFTGATYSRKGKFELSHGGTIFLDEVGDMSLPTQAKILRVLQEHTFERVGGEQTLTADTRIIAATNKSLVECIEDGHFRVDLFYRLKVVSIFLPALRKRPGDIPLLVDHFVSKYRRHSKTLIRGISQRAQALLEAQPWTGNVRELENAIQTAVVLNRTGTLDAADFPFLSNGAQTLGATGEVLERLREEARRGAKVLLADAREDEAVYHALVEVVERAVVEEALAQTGNNQVRAAKMLGISRNTLRSKIAASVDQDESRS
jgi:DNA-binding NtrC family response regulator